MISKNRLKELAVYKQQKCCDQDQVFVAEGVKMCDEILAANMPINVLCATNLWLSRHSELPPSVQVFEVDDAALERLSGLRTPNEVWMLLDRHALPAPKQSSLPLTLYRTQAIWAPSSAQPIGSAYAISSVAKAPSPASIPKWCSPPWAVFFAPPSPMLTFPTT